MSDWRAEIRARLAPLRLPPAREAEIVEEVSQHLDDRFRDRLTAGQDEATARAAAWRELETHEVLGREIARSERPVAHELPPAGAPARGRWMSAFWQDLRYAARTLRSQPVFTCTVLAALALSLGPATAIVSVGNWLFWRPLPGVTNADRLAVVWFGKWEGVGTVSPSGMSYLNLDDLKSRMQTANGLAGVQESSASLIVGEDIPRVIGLAHVTADFFDVLGVTPAAGRVFRREEDREPLGAPVAIISERLAVTSFGSVSNALTRRLVLNRQPFTVIGVTPAGFRGMSTTSNIDVWVTGAIAPYLSGRGNDGRPASRANGMFYMFVARLVPRVEGARLEAELGSLTRALADAHPTENTKFREVTARVYPRLGMDPLARPRLQAMVNTLLVIGAVLLLLGCANVANMLIARAIRREHEVAVRKALGASQTRLVQMQLTESCLLALGGAALGLGLAVVLKQVMQQWLFPVPAGMLTAVPIDGRVLAVTIGAALSTGVIAGLAPAWLSARSPSVAAMARGGGARTASRVPRLRSGLAILQLALSLTLLVGAVLLVTTLKNLRAVDLGFDPSNLTTLRVDLSPHGYTNERAILYQRDLLGVLEGSFQGVTLGQRAPFSSGSMIRVLPRGAAPTEVLRVGSNGVAHSYFATIATPLIRGRAFTADEAFASAPTDTTPIVINETLARRLFGEADPIGQTVHLTATANGPARDLPVIGVARDSQWNSITGAAEPFIYQPLGRYDFRVTQATVIVRSTQPAAAVAAIVRAAAARIDRVVPLSGGDPFAISIDRTIQQQRLFAGMLSWLSVLAFLLAAFGLHGLVSQTTAERSREFGIRLAIGASRADIARLVARYVCVIAGVGTAVGLVLAGFGVQLVRAMLFGVTAMDPMVYVVAIATMAVTVLVASAWPALRATRVQPVEVLRAE